MYWLSYHAGNTNRKLGLCVWIAQVYLAYSRLLGVGIEGLNEVRLYVGVM